MAGPKKELTYREGTTSNDIFRYIKAIGFPFIIFMLSLFTISRFALFGSKVIAPLSGIMWLFGVFVAFMLPSQRKSVLNETHATIGGYYIGLILIREMIALISGVSSEMLMATYGQAIPITSGTAFSGTLQSIMWATAIFVPFGFITMQGKKVLTLRRKGNKNREIERLRGIRDNGGHLEG